MRRIRPDQARRIAITSHGLAGPRPGGTPHIGHVQRAIRAMRLLQIDSVNVVERAHHLTLFSRLGDHDPALLWRALEERRVFEYWGRVASFCPIEDFPLYRHRMQRHADTGWRKLRELESRAPGYVESVYRQVEERGPLTTSDLDEPGERAGPWWGWADGKVALEYLFAAGRLAVSHRRNFTRYYDIVERVVPAQHLEAPAVSPQEAHRRLILHAARTQGIATARDLSDYFSLRVAEAGPIIAGLVEEAKLAEVKVEGWPQPAYLHTEATVPRRVRARTLLNPFDPYMWNRDRVERLHGFHYRIEIYVPRPKREFGYYVFPFLLGDELVARVDLKADRKAGMLRVQGAFLEDGADPTYVARELAAELHEMARWLGFGEIAIGRRGELVTPLCDVI